MVRSFPPRLPAGAAAGDAPEPLRRLAEILDHAGFFDEFAPRLPEGPGDPGRLLGHFRAALAGDPLPDGPAVERPDAHACFSAACAFLSALAAWLAGPQAAEAGLGPELLPDASRAVHRVVARALDADLEAERQASRDAHAYAEAALLAVRAGVAALDPDLRFLAADADFCQTCGLELGTLAGRPVDAALPVPALVTRLRAIDRTGAFRLILPRAVDGETRTLAFTAVPVAGELAHALLTVEDLTEDRRRAEEIRRTARSFRDLLELSPEAMFIVQERRLAFANPALARLLGHDDPAALAGRPVRDFLPDPAPAPEDCPFRAALEGRSVPPTRAALRSAAGEAVPVEATATAIHFEGAPAVLFACRDLRAQDALQSRAMQVDRMIAIGTLAAGVGHEINNPLAYVHANVAFAIEELAALAAEVPSPRLREVLAALEEARLGTTRIRDIASDLALFSRAEPTAEPEPVDLHAVIDSAIAMARNEIRHRARLVRAFGPAPTVLGVASRLGQVFLNLLVNAAHAIEPGQAARNAVRVETRLDGDAVEVAISDTGSGIEPAVLDRIFEPFFTTKPPGRGTGLGLPICRRIVEEHGGAITVESEPGRGTTFRVRLPTHDDRPAPEPEEPAVPTASARARVLVIDDDRHVLAALRRILGRNHEVLAFTDPRAALAAIAQGERWDFILCDLMMPEFGGAGFAEALERVAPDQLPDLHLLTAGTFTEEGRRFLERMEGRVVRKPFDPHALLELVARHLARRERRP